MVARYDALICSLGKEILDKKVEEKDLFNHAPFTPDGTLEQKKQLVEEAIEKNYEWVQSVTKIFEKKKIFDTIQEEISHKSKKNTIQTSQEDIQNATKLVQEFHQVNQKLQEVAHKISCLDTLEDIFESEKHNKTQQATIEKQEVLVQEDDEEEKKFKAFYMDQFTKAFGDELDVFRQEKESFETQKDLDQLIACIHTNGDLYSKEQKQLMMQQFNNSL
jgi:hypothetical protein